MKLYVAKRHIEKAKRILFTLKGDNFFKDFEKCCPISQAIREKTKKRVRTTATVCRIGCPSYGEKEYQLDKQARDFIRNFDAKNPVRPQWVTLEEIKEVVDES